MLYARHGKRLFDVLASAVALVALSPIFLLIGVWIRLEDRGPAIFRQTRVGRHGATFTLLKFRSMPVATPQLASSGAEHLPVTWVGSLIRRTNLDELPQLLNILLGQMSVVGPRPPIPGQESLIRLRRDNGALALRPGLTGLAQVSSYDGMPETEKAELDGRYAARISLPGDLAIIRRTVGYLGRRPPRY